MNTRGQVDGLLLRADALDAGLALWLAPSIVRDDVDGLARTLDDIDVRVAALSPDVVVPPRPFVSGKVALNVSSMVLLDAQLQRGARYVRASHHECLITSAVSMPFHWTSLAAGGSSGPFAYPQYKLFLGDVVNRGVEVGVASPIASATSATFVGNLGTLQDGPYIARIVAYDVAGVEVANPTESLGVFGLWVDRNGTAKDHPDVIFQNASYEWTHAESNTTWPPNYAEFLFAIGPKASLKAREVQLAWDNRPTGNPINAAFPGQFPGGTPFNTALPYQQLTRLNFVPCTDATYMDEHRPSVTSRGITVTENAQGYSADENVFSAWPRFPMFDGPRGVGTLYAPTSLWVGHAGSIYFLDAHSFGRVNMRGDVKRFAGLRHTVAPYWEEMRDQGIIADKTETVGNWDASIAPAKRYPMEGWMLVADIRTTTQDLSLPLIDVPPFGPIPQHAGIGPVFYSTCRQDGGRVLKYQFDKTNPGNPPYITEFLKRLLDPWGGEIGYDVFTPGDTVLFINERGRHAISMWSLPTGASLGDLLVNPNGAQFGAVNANPDGTWKADRSWKFAPPYMLPNGLPKWDLARAQNILAPEGGAYQDGFYYWGALAHGEVRRINVATRVIEVCCRVPVAYGGQSKWVDLKLSDGSFGPRGTIFTTAFDNTTSGRPRGWLQVPGVSVDGVSLTHSKEWDWQRDTPHVPNGPGGRTMVGVYATGLGVANGMLACGSSGPGLLVFMKADLGEPLPDEAAVHRGGRMFREDGDHLLQGNYGYGFVDELLPFGQHADKDKFLHLAGH